MKPLRWQAVIVIGTAIALLTQVALVSFMFGCCDLAAHTDHGLGAALSGPIFALIALLNIGGFFIFSFLGHELFYYLVVIRLIFRVRFTARTHLLLAGEHLMLAVMPGILYGFVFFDHENYSFYWAIISGTLAFSLFLAAAMVPKLRDRVISILGREKAMGPMTEIAPIYNKASEIRKELAKARAGLLIVSAGLAVSGLTCYFLPWELETLVRAMGALGLTRNPWSAEFYEFLVDTQAGVMAAESHPQLFLGTDYLGFAHVLFAILFLGALHDPVRNRWVVEFGVISSALVVPAALLFGWMRDAPLMHRFVDASFGVASLGIMLWVLKSVSALERGEPGHRARKGAPTNSG